jgi:hypothetical protein
MAHVAERAERCLQGMAARAGAHHIRSGRDVGRVLLLFNGDFAELWRAQPGGGCCVNRCRLGRSTRSRSAEGRAQRGGLVIAPGSQRLREKTNKTSRARRRRPRLA